TRELARDPSPCKTFCRELKTSLYQNHIRMNPNLTRSRSLLSRNLLVTRIRGSWFLVQAMYLPNWHDAVPLFRQIISWVLSREGRGFQFIAQTVLMWCTLRRRIALLKWNGRRLQRPHLR